MKDYIESIGAEDYFFVAYEQWSCRILDWLAHAADEVSDRSQMAESGMGGRFWFRAIVSGKDARNATYHDRTGTTPHHFVFEKPRNVSKFRAFGCKAFMYLNKDRREKGKHLPRAAEGIHLGFASDSNTSGYFPSTSKTLICNQVRFDESNFPCRKQSMVDRHVEDELVNILKEEGAMNWEPYDKSLPHGSTRRFTMTLLQMSSY